MVFNHSETLVFKIRNPTQRLVPFGILKKRRLLFTIVSLAHRLNYGMVIVAEQIWTTVIAEARYVPICAAFISL